MAKFVHQQIFSGIQPTGIPHLGNFCGAISKWIKLHSNQQRLPIFTIVDLHAITVPFEAKQLPQNIRQMAAALLGCGVDPNKCILYKQSDVLYHAELAWLLSTITPISWLNRMTQYKTKASLQEENELGLLSYPVLMAADILLYKGTHVPVGNDQLQHLELSRMIASRFNSRFNTDLFAKPQPLMMEDLDINRIMSLKDPTSKMSKSSPSEMSRINLTDSADQLRKKINKATTDSIKGITYDKTERPGVANLLAIYSALSGIPVPDLASQYQDASMGAFKKDLGELAVETICPIGDRIRQYENDPVYLDEVFKKGAGAANEIAANTIKQTKDAMGL